MRKKALLFKVFSFFLLVDYLYTGNGFNCTNWLIIKRHESRFGELPMTAVEHYGGF